MAGVASAVVVVALLASCSAASSSGATTTTAGGHGSTAPTPATTLASSAPGVTPTEIKIGSVSTLTGSIAADFSAFAPGMQAYFKWINAKGGINGRKLVLAYDLDDAGNPTTFTQLAHTLIQQDHVFAVAASTYWFTPNLFVQTKTPTYGYNVSGNWAGPANLFAAGGSVQDYKSGLPAVSYIIKRTDSKSVAIVSYGPAIASSYNACHADAQGLAAAGIKVSYDDLDAPLGGSLTSAVQKIQQAGADFIVSCMQGSDNITMARAIQQYGLKVHQLWFDGYDNSLLDQYSSLMQGVYLNVNGTVPFDAVKVYPGTYPGVQKLHHHHEEVRAQPGVLPGGPAGLAVGGAPGRRHQGRRDRPHPGQRDQADQPAHQLQRRGHRHHDQLEVRPHHQHLSGLQRLRAGEGDDLRARPGQGLPGVRLLQPGGQPQEPDPRSRPRRDPGCVSRSNACRAH